MKKIIGVIATVTALGFSGVAHAGFLESAFGNTVTISGADGTVMASYFFDEGGAFSMAQADGTSVAGSWTLDGSNLCVTVGEQSDCNDIQNLDVGESWTETTDDGTEIVISIVAGR